MRRVPFIGIVVTILLVLLVHSASAAEKELNAVSIFPRNHPLAVMIAEWVNRINDYCQGELQVKYLGGPEVIPRQEQIKALKEGLVQITFSSTTDYEPFLPEAIAFTLSKITPWEERRPGGFYDLMVERHRKINTVYLGRWLHGPSYLWLKDPAGTPGDLKGRKFQMSAPYGRFMTALETIPVPISIVETSTALKNGIVEGAGWPLLGVRELGWTETLKYVIDHPFYTQNRTILMNLDAWTGLPQALQEKIRNITAWFEPYMVGYFDSAISMEWREFQKIGVKRIRFSPSNAKSFLDTAYNVEWKALEEKTPDLVPLLRKLTAY
jgi:TRAP-type C4-dicarboxylate transport system substrate-binding protein